MGAALGGVGVGEGVGGSVGVGTGVGDTSGVGVSVASGSVADVLEAARTPRQALASTAAVTLRTIRLNEFRGARLSIEPIAAVKACSAHSPHPAEHKARFLPYQRTR